jgi:3-isopropylmalate/(R)-2-methylmalate dehydratase large subunit
VSPEQGIALPGLTLVCPDSHTGTIGGLGALAWGIGSTEAEHALATQTLVVRRPPQMRVRFDGRLSAEVSAKDLILYLIGRYSASGGAGHAIEFAGPVVQRLSIESRLTLCNMAVEFGAWTGVVAPDEATIEYVANRPYVPQGENWPAAVQAWRQLPSDEAARFDRELDIDASAIGAQVTWGTSPEQVVSIDAPIPCPDAGSLDAQAREARRRALAYMGLEPGRTLAGLRIEAAFIGSCTNARLSDLRQAAAVLKGRKVARGVRALCVPGSTAVKRAAEEEGLDRLFRKAGFEWHESGCSMCFYAGGETFAPGQRVISSTNRNFEGRQGPGVRTHLASPATVAASAVLGRIAHAGELQREAV